MKTVDILFGVRKYYEHIDAVAISKNIGNDKALVLPLFHAITGCDTVSSFGKKGKNNVGMFGKLIQISLNSSDNFTRQFSNK